MRFGLIGCGRISQKHLSSLAAIAGAELVAVSDVVPESMDRAEQQFLALTGRSGSIKKYVEYGSLLADPEVEVAIVAASSGQHAKIAKAALYAGKHVVLEKPMTLSLKEADDIISLAAARERTVLVCHQLRYRPIMQTIKKYVENRSLGQIHLGVVSMRIHRPAEYYQAAPWRGSWREDGGMLLNQGIHMVDLLQWFLGEITTVYGDIRKGPIEKETEDVALGLLTFASGAKGMIEANTVTYPSNLEYSLSLFGEHGTLSIGGPQMDQIYRWAYKNQIESEEHIALLAKQKNEHVMMYQDLIDSIQQGSKEVLIHAREGKKALETIFALYQSAVTARPVVLPLHQFETAQLSDIMKTTGWLT
ncbi:MAG TPA: Gfo/Idh/MocA family oxidoreductase [Candidatus Bathyarchaeia archaeon]|nr:Gfo/Idh/MocA family oxidoreductase [Candidatus Bathyarchaeia archaeon]